MLHVRLRAAVPGVITGMRIAMGGAWTSIELAASTGAGPFNGATVCFGLPRGRPRRR
jgi:ABC-type nitrate/sulfonate/bicarbonate transport system permease component